MGFFSSLMGELIDVIEWIDNSSDTMVYRFDREQNEIKNGAKLIVRESQIAVFVKEGVIADIFDAGLYELSTNNLPILTTINHWDHGFNSPFKAEIYFFSTKRFIDNKWGTKNPIMLRDKEFGPIRLRAFGSYGIKIEDPEIFLKEIVGTDGYFTVDEVSDQLRNLIVSRFATIVGQMSVPILDLASNYEQVGDFIEEKISPEFSAYGLELTKLLVENISLPPKVEEALDKRSSMGIMGNLDDYLKFQSAEALSNGSGGGSSTASDAMGMGMGFAMASQMANSMNTNSSQNSSYNQQVSSHVATPPPIPKAQIYHAVINTQSSAPMTIEQMKTFVANSSITKETLVWRDGMSEWQKAGSLSELNRLFTSMPPPIPR